MLFNFTLTPIEQIQPWGKPGDQRLHWFGLTDGQYWIQAGDAVLFEYSEHVRSKPGATRYCDYQVVRLHEDLLQMLPSILEAVPTSLVPYISGESGRAWMTKSATWATDAFDLLDEDRYWELADASATWISNRTLDSGYLSPSAGIRIWSEQSIVHIEWDNTGKLYEGLAVWSAARGSFRLPRETFMEEVRSFHTRLLSQMADRVEKVVAGTLAPEVQIALAALQREQLARYLTLEGALNGSMGPTDWQTVLMAVAEIERSAEES